MIMSDDDDDSDVKKKSIVIPKYTWLLLVVSIVHCLYGHTMLGTRGLEILGTYYLWGINIHVYTEMQTKIWESSIKWYDK